MRLASSSGILVNASEVSVSIVDDNSVISVCVSPSWADRESSSAVSVETLSWFFVNVSSTSMNDASAESKTTSASAIGCSKPFTVDSSSSVSSAINTFSTVSESIV